ncbi:MAG: protein jag [Candidatus Sumerlaeia bacterium]
MSSIQITAETREEAKKEALRRLGLPEEALDIEWSQEEEDLLPGAKPFIQMNASVRPEYVAEKTLECTRGILEKMDIDFEVQSVIEHGMVIVRIESEKAEVLIGYRGETLDALQHLVVRMARMSGREIPLVLLDVGNYRQKRINRLERVCDDLVELVLENGEEEHFDPMDATDRKIVHTLLKERPGIKTFSRGEDMNRHVIVAPDS